MIDFLYPLATVAAVAAAVPLILHLIRRREMRRVVFPAVRYLIRTERHHARRLRLRHLLLLATRVALILLAATAAAGPLVGRGDASDHHPTSLAIVLDHSQSTGKIAGDHRLFDTFRERARLAVDLSTADDRVALFPAAVAGEPIVTTDPSALRAYLDELEPVPARADLNAALEGARGWLGAQDGERQLEIHLLSDLQAISLSADSRAREPRPVTDDPVTVVALAPGPPGASNGAVGEVRPDAIPLNAGHATRVHVRPRWFDDGDAPDTSVVVRLVLGDAVLDAAEARFGAAVTLTLPGQEPGWLQGHVEIDRSGLSADDRRHFTWFARPPPAVATRGPRNEFVDHALDVLDRAGRVRTGAGPVTDVSISIGGAGAAQAVTNGRSVIVVPPDSSLDLPLLNSRLERARIPWRYESRAPGSGSTRVADEPAVEGLAGIVVREWYALTPTGLGVEDSTLVGLVSEDPWVVRGTTAGGVAYLLLASPLNPNASELPVSPAMLPFVDIALGIWTRNGPVAGTELEGVGRVRLSPRAELLVTAEGDTVPVEAGAWHRPRRAGNYRVLGNGEMVQAFSVNAPVLEADLRRGDRSEAVAMFPDAEWHWLPDTALAEWQRAIYRSRRGHLAWEPFVIGLLALMILESALAAPGRAGKSPSSAQDDRRRE